MERCRRQHATPRTTALSFVGSLRQGDRQAVRQAVATGAAANDGLRNTGNAAATIDFLQQCCIWLAKEARFGLRSNPPGVNAPFVSQSPMPRSSPPPHRRVRPASNPALCASAATRLAWAAGALFLLWSVILWALA